MAKAIETEMARASEGTTKLLSRGTESPKAAARMLKLGLQARCHHIQQFFLVLGPHVSWFAGIKCHNCGEYGHMARNCPQKSDEQGQVPWKRQR